jgi:hypothetical protein
MSNIETQKGREGDSLDCSLAAECDEARRYGMAWAWDTGGAPYAAMNSPYNPKSEQGRACYRGYMAAVLDMEEHRKELQQ